MDCFEHDGLADVYPAMCQTVMDHGDDVSPRGAKTKELCDVTIKLNDPTDVVLPAATNRVGYRPAIGVAEGLCLIAGVADPALMTRVSRAFTGFTDGGAFHGAYGPRLRFQLPRIIDRLQDDEDTRQAVVTIWDPLYDGASSEQEPPRDLPCTVYLNFRVRNGQLTLKTHMRSNDLWLGFPYDVFQFTLLQRTVAYLLGVEAGPYVHHVDSLHLYERHWLPAREVQYAPCTGRTRLRGVEAASWAQARLIALELLYQQVGHSSTTEEWLAAQLDPYREVRVT